MRNQITTLMPGAFKGYESLYQMYVPYLEALGEGGGGGGLWLYILCSLTNYQELWHNCSLFVNTSFDTN